MKAQPHQSRACLEAPVAAQARSSCRIWMTDSTSSTVPGSISATRTQNTGKTSAMPSRNSDVARITIAADMITR